MATVIDVINKARKRMGLPAFSAVLTSTGAAELQMLNLITELGREMAEEYDWAELVKEHTFTLATSTETYAFPNDFSRWLPRTMWNRDESWEMRGPLPAQEWQWRKSGTIASFPRQRYRVKGHADKQIYIDPVPDASDNGSTVAFEFLTASWVRPKTWITSTTFAAGAHCFYNGNTYSTTNGGSTGATAPTHTTGDASDDSVTWSYDDAAYTEPLKDDDVVVLDEETMILGLVSRFREANGLPFATWEGRFQTRLASRVHAYKGQADIQMGNRANPLFISTRNVPDAGFG